MKYYIALDAGGTKTDGILLDDCGCVIVRTLNPGGNPNDIGEQEAKKRLLDAVTELAAAAPEPVSAAFAGIAGVSGYGNRFEEWLGTNSGIIPFRTGSDAQLLLTGAFNRGDGCCLIAGTGSVCFVRQAGELTRIGGWGYLLDPSGSGSGFDLGRDALVAVLHEYDGQGDKTCLTDLICKRLGAHPKDIIPKIYAGGRSYVASLSGAVFEGCEMWDAVSISIVERNCARLAKMLLAAGKQIKKPFRAALGGGVFTNHPEYSERLKSMLPADIGIFINDLPAIYGAAVEAVYAGGGEISDGFRDNFTASYASKLADLSKQNI